jgi:hypothetical protein
MKIARYLIITFSSILLLLFIITRLTKPETVMISGEEVSLENPWRKTTESENYKFDRLTDECEKLYMKDIGSGDLILACLKKNKSWDFYWATPKKNERGNYSSELKKNYT